MVSHKVFVRGGLLPVLLVFLFVLPAAAQTGEPEATPPAANEGASISVEDAAVCLEVAERQPVGGGDRFPSDVEKLTCFNRIVGGDGESVVHAWIHEGTTRARVVLEVGSDSWRTWSTKTILPSWTGAWEVKIMTPAGQVLHSVTFTVY